jgi:catechol 2,3-dioxygenase-like lactoylglutathione lyase family enzyme
VAVITPDPAASRKLYVDALGLPLKNGGDDGYHHGEQIAGCKSFGIWPLSQAAEACFGTPQWPAERPVPQVSIEFDVADAAAVDPAARELEQTGYELLHPPREEPWGQTVGQAAIARGRDRRDLVRPRAARSGLTGGREGEAARRPLIVRSSGVVLGLALIGPPPLMCPSGSPECETNRRYGVHDMDSEEVDVKGSDRRFQSGRE